MAPSGGYPDLDDFANVCEDELAQWSKTQVLRACFAFDLVAEGAEGDVEKLRDRLLQRLRCSKGEFPGTVPEERKRGGMSGQPSGEHSSPLPYVGHVSGHRVLAPPGATQHSAPEASDASVPFGAGVFDRPPAGISRSEGLNLSSLLEKVANALREDDFAALDARDTLAEGDWRTPSPGAQRSVEGSDSGLIVTLVGDMEYVDDTMSDGGGPWTVVRGRKWKPAERSPFKTPLCSPHGRPNIGHTPVAIRSLPDVPAELRPNPTPHRESNAMNVNPSVSNQTSNGADGMEQ